MMIILMSSKCNYLLLFSLIIMSMSNMFIWNCQHAGSNEFRRVLLSLLKIHNPAYWSWLSLALVEIQLTRLLDLSVTLALFVLRQRLLRWDMGFMERVLASESVGE